MARIIDKIRARRNEFKSEREALAASHHQQQPNIADDNIPSHLRNRPQRPRPQNNNENPPTQTTKCATDTTVNEHAAIQPGWYYSLEFFPPKTEPGLDNLLTRIDRMSRRLDPLFISVTWGANGSTLSRTLAVASHAQRFACVDVLLHLSCTGLTREQISQVLGMAKSSGVRNILALRGDPPQGKRAWREGDVSGGECSRAIDLVKLIRKLHGDYFGIGVAGHPEGHPSSGKGEDGKIVEMQHLKEKLDAGAEFIITQFFYDANVFLDYVKRCRKAGIDCPIIPGIMPIQSYSSMLKMTQFCGISVPPSVIERLQTVRHDDEAVKKIGCEIAAEMCRTVLTYSLSREEDTGEDMHVDGFHFYTLNLERSTTRILANLGAIDVLSDSGSAGSLREKRHGNKKKVVDFVPECEHGVDGANDKQDCNEIPAGRERQGSISERARSTRRVFPWKPSAMENRSREDVRPINWSNRPKSYVMRTDDWDEYPNGRWGDSTSPAFGELSELSHFYSFTLGCDDDRRAMLGNCPVAETDVYEVFARYVEGTVPHIPWCETPLQPESFLVQPQLARLNRYGLLTVNSQPPVDGVSSNHPVFGWGGKGGRVYQKAYVECFVSPDKANRLTRMVTNHPNMNLYAVNYAGQELRVGVESGGVTALTWGVFPNREILQPTIFDPDTFLVWAEEAFSLWTTMWLNLYDFESDSYELIEKIRDTYYLVAIIDNDFFTSGGKDGSSFGLLDSLLQVGKESAS
ncbi:hypothetical protein ACHAXR_013235 [Thalassiosira sp. AJA248-18]